MLSVSYYATTAYGAIAHFATGGNDSNLVQNCQLGDPNGTIRAQYAVYSYGSSTSAFNIGNKVLDCDILNWGPTSYASTIYPVYINYYNLGFIFEGNKLHKTSAAYYYYEYWMYIYEYYGYSRNTVVERNRFYGMMANTYTSYTYIYLMYHYAYYSGSATGVGTNFRFNNNMINYDPDGTQNIYYYGCFFYSGYYSQYAGVVDINHNTHRYAGGVGTTYYTYYPMYIYGYGTNGGDGPDVWHHYNNIYEFNRPNIYYGWMVYYVSTGWLSDYNIVNWWLTPYQYAVYYYSSGGGQVYATQFSQYQSSTGKDANTLTQVTLTFADPSSGDLHIPSGCASLLNRVMPAISACSRLSCSRSLRFRS